MTYLIRFFALILLAILCFRIGSTPATVNAQGSDTNQGELTLISHDKVITQLLNFTQQTPEDCTLPCFAEIRPDETTLPEIQALANDLFEGDDSLLTQFNKPFKREDNLLDYTLRIDSPYVTGGFTLSFIVSPQDEVLRRFKAHLFRPENWLESSNLDISEVLADLETPDEVYVVIAASQPPGFGIVVGYQTLGTVFYFDYSFEPEQLTQSDEPIPLCGSWSKMNYVDVWIQAVDEELYEASLDENLGLSQRNQPWIDGLVHRGFWPLEHMTNWSIEDFKQSIANNPEWCFDALSYEVLLESGYTY